MIDKIQRAVASLHNKKDDEKGFSLIELIVVVAILGILIAIAIPVFNGLQDKATENAAKSAAANAATEVASQIAATGSAPSAPPAATEEFAFSFDGGIPPATVDAVCIEVTAVSGSLPTPSSGDYKAGPGC